MSPERVLDGGPSTDVRHLFDAVQVPLALTDQEGLIVRTNDAFAAACSAHPADLLHRPAADLLEWSALYDDFPAISAVPPVWRLRGSPDRPGPTGTTTVLIEQGML